VRVLRLSREILSHGLPLISCSSAYNGHPNEAGAKAMKVQYDPETDTLTINLREERIKESEEVRPGVIADYGYDGGLVRFEGLRASKVVEKANEMQFAVGA
jgi:uncharacterized protein YuzE